MINEHKSGVMPLTTLMRRLRAADITLSWDTSFPGQTILVSSQPIPATLRRATQAYSRELLALLLLADARLCHNPKWHKRYWNHTGNKRYSCACCGKHNRLANRDPLHQAGDIVQVQSKQEEEVSA